MDLKIIEILARQGGRYILKNSPSILTYIAVGGVATTTGMAISATGPALDVIYDEREQRYKDSISTGLPELPITVVDYIKLTWRIYAPTVTVALMTMGCIVGANTINVRRQAALAALYGLAKESYTEYKEKVQQTLGEKREAKMREEMEQDRLDRNPVDSKQIIITGRGESLCWDPLSNRYFMSNIDDINRGINKFNKKVIDRGEMGVNEFYDEIGMPHCDLANNLGWSSGDKLVEISFTSKIAHDKDPAIDNRPCLVLKYAYGPTRI